jgi:tRNA(Ile)-lysidine synthase
LGIELVVAHYDHGLRRAEDAVETRFVRDLADSMDLPCETEGASGLAGGTPSSLEEKARDARYAFLDRVREKSGASRIAMGHNLNDQAETVLMRLLRGSGPSGLAGIPPVRDRTIIRPLIDTVREEILAYLEARGLGYVTDSSNLETRHLRNRIRLELLPLLLDYQPRLVEHLGRLAAILRGEDRYMETLAEAWIHGEADAEPANGVTISLSSFLGLPLPMRNRVARQLLARVKGDLRRIESAHIRSIDRLAGGDKPQAAIDLPKGIVARRVYDRLTLERVPLKGGFGFHYLLEGPGTYLLKEIDRRITLTEGPAKEEIRWNRSSNAACLDAGGLQYPLEIRNFQPGDRLVPLGMKGHKKIKDLFVDLKVPSRLRQSTPILLSRGKTVWVCGYRIDDRFKVTKDTRRVLKVVLSRDAGCPDPLPDALAKGGPP